MSVSTLNFTRLMRWTPAGMEIRLRMPGMTRPMRIAMSPNRSNQCRARSTSSPSVSHIFSAIARSRSAPITAPSQYSSQAPIIEPAVDQANAANAFMCPSVDAKPESGRTTSLGIGGKTVSMRIARPTPGAPMVSMRETSQSSTEEITEGLSGDNGSGTTEHPMVKHVYQGCSVD